MNLFKLAREHHVVKEAPEPKPVAASLLVAPAPVAKRKASVKMRAVVKVIKKGAPPTPAKEEASGGGLFGLAGYGDSDDESS
jgi:hypothetical protein